MNEKFREEYEERFSPDGEKIQHDIDFPNETPTPHIQSEWKEKLKKEFEEIMFASCPTEEKEPFFWRWTEEGKKTLLDFIFSEAEKLLHQEREDIIEKIKGKLCEECKCEKSKWEMNRCVCCRKVGINQRTANDVLNELISLLNTTNK